VSGVPDALLIPSLSADLSLSMVEKTMEDFIGTNSVHEKAKLQLCCATIRELGRKGYGSLANALARKVAGNNEKTQAADRRTKKVFSALLEGYCGHRELDNAIDLYLEMVGTYDCLPANRSLHMLAELLLQDDKKKETMAKDENNQVHHVSTGNLSKPTQTLTVHDIFQEMKSRAPVTTAIYNMLLSVIAQKQHKIAAIKNLLQEIKGEKAQCNHLTWKALLETARYKRSCFIKLFNGLDFCSHCF